MSIHPTIPSHHDARACQCGLSEALQSSSNISCAHESCLVIQLELIKTICQIKSIPSGSGSLADSGPRVNFLAKKFTLNSRKFTLVKLMYQFYIWQMDLIGRFNSVRRISDSSHWKKIFSAVVWLLGEEDKGPGGILHFVGKLRLWIPDQALCKL